MVCWIPRVAASCSSSFTTIPVNTLPLCGREAYALDPPHPTFPALSQLIHGDLHYDNVMVVGDQVGPGMCGVDK